MLVRPLSCFSKSLLAHFSLVSGIIDTFYSLVSRLAHASAVEQAKGPWDHFQMDYCEVTDDEGNKHHIFTVADVYTRYMWAYDHGRQDVNKVIGEIVAS